MAQSWAETTSLANLRAMQLGSAGEVFRCGEWLLRTTGKLLAQGGMGSAYLIERFADDGAAPKLVVGKTFHASYLAQLRSDEVTKRDHLANTAALGRIMQVEHPNVLPTYLATAIADNYLFVTPRMGATLMEAIPRFKLTPRERTKLLIQAIEGLASLHDERIVHRDVTLRNILLDESGSCAFLFDFDLALCLDDLPGATYASYYQGRVFGSPGYSVPPETIEGSLMDNSISTALDIYAIGGSIHALFTDELVYGPTDDMWALLVRIAEGVVVGGRSSVYYPDAVPASLRPIIDRCLERDPQGRYGNVQAVLRDLRAVLPALDDRLRDQTTFATTWRTDPDEVGRVEGVFAGRTDQKMDRDRIELGERAVRPSGYQLRRSLGQVKGHDIFVVVPQPKLLAAGQFPDANRFPKLVTRIDLKKVARPQELIELWYQRYLPVLRQVRQGLLTTLHKVVYERETESLLLFSELIDDPVFGTALDDLDLPIDAAMALGFLVVRQVAALHERGVAHNNVHPGALLFKGLHDSGTVQPAMIGLVEPSLAASAMEGDVRALCGMILAWLRPRRIGQLPTKVRPTFEALRVRLEIWAKDRATPPPGIDTLVAVTSDGLSLVDFNFSVLRDSGGDLQEYAVLILSHRLYHLLWS